jgi:tetratricopeptide (TPR) repeat protein
MAADELESQAIALFRAGHFADAEKAFRAIVAKDPRHRDALLALGIIAAPSGRLDEAADVLARATGADARSYPAFFHLGSALRQSGRLDEARAAFGKAIEIDPKAPEAHVGLGNTLREQGEGAAARASFDAALALAPDFPSARYNLALLELDEGHLAAAEACLESVVAREPRNAAAWNNLGVVRRKSDSPAGARQAFERAVEADPANADALNNLGLAHQAAEDIDGAIALYKRAVEARPNLAQAFTNWGNALKDRGDLSGANERYQKALAADPRDAAALVNSGSVALERGLQAQARRFFERALQARPGFADARYGLGLIALYAQDFERGWEGYEARFETDPPVATLHPPRLPRYAPGGLGMGRLAVRAEQGLGDQILFSTLLPELGEAPPPIVELDARLVTIYRRSVRGFEFTSPEHAVNAMTECGQELPLGSLPAIFRRDASLFRKQPGLLLTPDPARVTALQSALPPGKRVAISWRSFQKAGRRHIAARKSIPLECFAALAPSGVKLLDLQYGDVAAERAAFDAAHPGLRIEAPGVDLREDIEGVLAAIACCDLVITASNVTAHFAGALGRKTWLVYLGANAPFHYWVPNEKGRSPWYPSVEVVTDAGWTRWEQAFDALAQRLRG